VECKSERLGRTDGEEGRKLGSSVRGLKGSRDEGDGWNHRWTDNLRTRVQGLKVCDVSGRKDGTLVYGFAGVSFCADIPMEPPRLLFDAPNMLLYSGWCCFGRKGRVCGASENTAMDGQQSMPFHGTSAARASS
jgi:hypothetical protein